MYIFDLPKEILKSLKNLKIIIFADDVLIYGKNADDIRKALENLSSYCDKYNLTVNIKEQKS